MIATTSVSSVSGVVRGNFHDTCKNLILIISVISVGEVVRGTLFQEIYSHHSGPPFGKKEEKKVLRSK